MIFGVAPSIVCKPLAATPSTKPIFVYKPFVVKNLHEKELLEWSSTNVFATEFRVKLANVGTLPSDERK